MAEDKQLNCYRDACRHSLDQECPSGESRGKVFARALVHVGAYTAGWLPPDKRAQLEAYHSAPADLNIAVKIDSTEQGGECYNIKLVRAFGVVTGNL